MLEYCYLVISASPPTCICQLLQTFWSCFIIVSFENNKYDGCSMRFTQAVGSKRILDGPAHLHPRGAAEQLSPPASAGARRRQGGSHWPGHWPWRPGSINLDKMFLRIKAKRLEIDDIRLC